MFVKIPELLAPAGDMERLKVALAYGADAVYLGGKNFGLRAFSGNFSPQELTQACAYAHERGRKVYVTVNIFPHNAEITELPGYLKQLAQAGCDAILVADPGVFSLARELIPQIPLHISTQANTTNWRSAKSWQEQGAERVVLARELSLAEIQEIRQNVSLELECFVHGAMCMAFSGRCLFSNYLTGRDGNHGECAQPCRWKYSIVEEKRPGQYFPIEQTAEGAYLFNSQDMNMLAHIDDLLDSGATSLKIEGRSKSAYYIAAMTNAYKTAVNEYMVQRGFEDADGNVLKPFRDRVIRPGDPEYGKPDTEDAIMSNADGAFAGKPDIDAIPVGGVPSGNVSAGNVSSGNIAIGEPDNLSYHARSTRRKSNTAAEILPEGWHHAGARPAPHVTLPDWLLDEPDKVAHRDYSTGFYYPEHKVQQSTDRSAYFRAWLVVGEVLSWSPEDGGRVTIMSRNKIEAGQEVEFVLPGAAPFAYTVPAGGFRDADGHWVEAINNPAHVFSMPCPQEVPVNAAIRSRTKKPTLKAE